MKTTTSPATGGANGLMQLNDGHWGIADSGVGDLWSDTDTLFDELLAVRADTFGAFATTPLGSPVTYTWQGSTEPAAAEGAFTADPAGTWLVGRSKVVPFSGTKSSMLAHFEQPDPNAYTSSFYVLEELQATAVTVGAVHRAARAGTGGGMELIEQWVYNATLRAGGNPSVRLTRDTAANVETALGGVPGGQGNTWVYVRHLWSLYRATRS